MTKYIFIFFCIILIPSCTVTNLVSIEVREPALISFENPQQKNIVIVNNSASQSSEGVEANGEALKDSSVMPTDTAKAIFTNSLRQYLSEENYFSKVELYPYPTNGGAANEVRSLSARKVQTICKEQNADVLLSLDLFIASASLESVNVEYFNNYSILSSQIGVLLKAYSLDGSLLAPPIAYVDSLFRESSVSWNNMKNNIPEINDLVTEITMKAADAVTSSIVPSWKTDNRWYYSDSSKGMREATDMVVAGKWQEAADIWSELYDKEKNTNKKIRLASNIALANENLDDIENALAWINIAYDLLPQKSNSDLASQVFFYKETLTKRNLDKNKLYKQLGIDPRVNEDYDIEKEVTE